MTFEDIAVALRDVKYAEMMKADGEPFKQIKKQKQTVLDQFLESKDGKFSFEEVINEPLGRYFLEKFADVTSEEYETGVKYHRKRAYQHKVLSFVGDFLELSKRDKIGILAKVDILVLVESHDLIEFFDEAMGLSKSEKTEEDPHVEIQSLSRKVEEANGEVLSFESIKEEIEAEFGKIDFSVRPKSKRGETSGEEGSLEKVRLVFNAQKNENSSFLSLNTCQKETVEDTEVGFGSLLRKGRVQSTGESKLSSFVERDVSSSSSQFDFKLNGSEHFERQDEKTCRINSLLKLKIRQEMTPLWLEMTNNDEIMREYIRFRFFSCQHISDKNIKQQRPLGQGAFGTVYACVVTEIGVLMAMKKMSKSRILEKKAKKQVIAEYNTLLELSKSPSPYCMRLRYAYSTKYSFNVIIPLAIGGDLKYQLNHNPISFERAKVYAAEIAFGLTHMHQLGFVNRDLKLRNILIDENGHCKLSDFGLATRQLPHKGRAGTEGYWSPEVLTEKYYAYDCDWWSYGVCIFELIAAKHPFSASLTQLKSRNEGTLSKKLYFPDEFPDSARELCEALLKFKRKDRICTTRQCLSELMDPKFSFWEGLDLQAIRLGSGKALWVPVKGTIYAEKSSHIEEYEEDRRAKMGKAGDIPFEYFVDKELHQTDLVRILSKQTKHPRLLRDKWTSEDVKNRANCACSIC